MKWKDTLAGNFFAECSWTSIRPRRASRMERMQVPAFVACGFFRGWWSLLIAEGIPGVRIRFRTDWLLGILGKGCVCCRWCAWCLEVFSALGVSSYDCPANKTVSGFRWAGIGPAWIADNKVTILIVLAIIYFFTFVQNYIGTNNMFYIL